VKVLYVAPNIRLPGTNGGSTHVTEVAAGLRRHGPVLVLAHLGSRGEGVAGLGATYIPGLRQVLPFLYLPRAARLARAFRPDVIYERYSAYGLGALLKGVCRVPLVTMVLDYGIGPLSRRWADRFVATEPALLPPRLRERTTRVFWGANPERFRPDADGAGVRRRLGLEGFRVVGYTGAFYPFHGLGHLVEAAALLPDPAVRFLLVGDGAVRRQVEARVRELGLGGRFVFTGRVPYGQVPDHVAACDVCLAPYEPARHRASTRHGDLAGFPLKVLEYLAAGRPVIATGTTNVRALFADRTHLRTVPPADPPALAAALREVLGDPAAAAAMAGRGRALVLERYTWQRHADHLDGIFRELVAARAAQRAASSR